MMYNIKYHLSNGELLSYIVRDNLTIADIDNIASRYFELSHEFPKAIFLSIDVYRRLLLDCSSTNRNEDNILTSFHLSVGTLPVNVVYDMRQNVVVVGNENDYECTRIDYYFERDCLV